jgi:hypothetical protein
METVFPVRQEPHFYIICRIISGLKFLSVKQQRKKSLKTQTKKAMDKQPAQQSTCGGAITRNKATRSNEAALGNARAP